MNLVGEKSPEMKPLPGYIIALQQQVAELTQRVEALEQTTTINVKVAAEKMVEIMARKGRGLG